jgi:hypothetical protein
VEEEASFHRHHKLHIQRKRLDNNLRKKRKLDHTNNRKPHYSNRGHYQLSSNGQRM